ncbi:ABC transporter permease [Pseudoleptotrichia goodfellowii]|uniref:Inner-membrane translocator n=1 Tax=Pseudoleptotrichia goodfellowii TaxID=157692 RepID=A0A510J9R9_9FUSO|nr:ABC transporter permease [Pseudoleptotrichia goodfellowii]BBM36050.1 inner-membrane translocator [Pseudoleptotrichia goodfellowii]
MNELLVFMQSLPEAFKTGFIYSIMVMGVYITYKILDFPDLSVDGTFPLGAFIFAGFAMSKNGFFGITHPIMGLVLATVGGMMAGYVTGALHTYLNIEGLLAGIIVMTGLYSINFRIIGGANGFIPDDRSIYEIVSYDKNFVMFTIIFLILLVLKGFYDYKIKKNKYVIRALAVYTIMVIALIVYVFLSKDIKLMLVALIVFILKMILDYILTSKFGFALRALGSNEQLVISLGVNEKRLKIFGLMLSNGFAALSGALYAQSLKAADLQLGFGVLVMGLAAIILGLGIIKKSQAVNEISIVILGSLLYYFIINVALMSNNWTRNLYDALGLSDGLKNVLEIKPTDVKVITAIILTVILWNETAKRIRKSRKKAKLIEKERGI